MGDISSLHRVVWLVFVVLPNGSVYHIVYHTVFTKYTMLFTALLTSNVYHAMYQFKILTY